MLASDHLTTHQKIMEWWKSLSPEVQASEHRKSRYPHIPLEVFGQHPTLIKMRWLVAMKDEGERHENH